MHAVKLPGEAKQNNLPHKCGQPIVVGVINIYKYRIQCFITVDSKSNEKRFLK
jgi:hypothetical protein